VTLYGKKNCIRLSFHRGLTCVHARLTLFQGKLYVNYVFFICNICYDSTLCHTRLYSRYRFTRRHSWSTNIGISDTEIAKDARLQEHCLSIYIILFRTVFITLYAWWFAAVVYILILTPNIESGTYLHLFSNAFIRGLSL